MTEPCHLVYVTAATADDALGLARTVVEERLAACANLLGPITSVYWWDGRVNQEPEVAMVLKTRADLVDALVQRVRELHTYACPCVVALPIAAGNPDFLAWIAAETRR
ncbi:divalent-cation tolerance protein CutA [Magnetospirillum sp. UT-4]|uniref:divalent-cation tolerance protein CutA n=1 Tax=Magnetospirillum sp. UT-4 TaxID=2681467 RepID=UPI00137EE52B|nr:divalent-cation tolerance protein CutA [Magnetospirillum sp. UT-4]CAA7617874.1 CutA1 divalent ion tolerance protein [Magnetospirillum sp. UT-4]